MWYLLISKQANIAIHMMASAGSNIYKCQFEIQQCTYIGFIVGSGLLKLEIDKLQAIKQLPTPKTKHDFRAFLGSTGYYRKLIANYATVAAPFTDSAKKNSLNQVI